jgi:integrase/recombinase XerC
MQQEVAVAQGVRDKHRGFIETALPRTASAADLHKLRQQLAGLPTWLRETLDAYVCWRWPTWRAQSALQVGGTIVRSLKRIWCWLDAHRPVASWQDLHRADLEAWLQARSQAGVKSTTIQTELNHLRMILRFLEARDVELDPGLFRVQPPKVSHQPLPRYLAEPDYQRLETTVLQATAPETYLAAFDRAWFLTLAHTGMRIGEVLALQVGHLNFTNASILVQAGKGSRDRVVYMTPQLQRGLARYLEFRHPVPPQPHVFLTRTRQRPPSADYIRQRLKHYSLPLGFNATPHQLRHTLATRLLNRGMPIDSLRKLLGHRDLNTTQRYAQVYEATVYHQFEDAMNRVEATAVEGWPLTQVMQTPLSTMQS